MQSKQELMVTGTKGGKRGRTEDVLKVELTEFTPGSTWCGKK